MKNTFMHTGALVGLLTVSAYFLADTTGVCIGKSLEAAPTPPSSALSRSFLPSGRELAYYAPVLERGLFGEAGMQSKGSPAAASTTYTLIGTVEGAFFSGAVLEDGKLQTFYRMHQKLPDGAMIVKVLRRRISLRRPDGVIVDLETADDAKIVSAGRSGGRTVQRLANNKYIVDQREVIAGTENLGAILTQARAVPYIEHGKTMGFRISEIAAGSIFTKIGLQNGDIVQKVNSQELDNPAKFFELYQGLRNERNISIDLVRGGRRETLNYEIR